LWTTIAESVGTLLSVMLNVGASRLQQLHHHRLKAADCQ
jgi:hypothetical protein